MHSLIHLTNADQMQKQVPGGIVACRQHEMTDFGYGQARGRREIVRNSTASGCRYERKIESLVTIELAQIEPAKHLKGDA